MEQAIPFGLNGLIVKSHLSKIQQNIITLKYAVPSAGVMFSVIIIWQNIAKWKCTSRGIAVFFWRVHSLKNQTFLNAHPRGSNQYEINSVSSSLPFLTRPIKDADENHAHQLKIISFN